MSSATPAGKSIDGGKRVDPRRDGVPPLSTAADAGRSMALLQSSAGHQAVRRLLGRGAPLPEDVRAEMEARFGTSFADVRVHADPAAHALAAAVDANALACASDVVFGSGRFAPGSGEGRRLLAHELAHVVQQRRGGAVPRLERGAFEASLEAGADRAADAAVASSGPIAVAGASAPGVALSPISPERSGADTERPAEQEVALAGGVVGWRQWLTQIESMRFDEEAGRWTITIDGQRYALHEAQYQRNLNEANNVVGDRIGKLRQGAETADRIDKGIRRIEQEGSWANLSVTWAIKRYYGITPPGDELTDAVREARAHAFQAARAQQDGEFLTAFEVVEAGRVPAERAARLATDYYDGVMAATQSMQDTILASWGDLLQLLLGVLKGVGSQATDLADTAFWATDELRNLSGGSTAGLLTVTTLAGPLGLAVAPAVSGLAAGHDTLKAMGVVDQSGRVSTTAPFSATMEGASKEVGQTLGSTFAPDAVLGPFDIGDLGGSLAVQAILASTGVKEVTIAADLVGAVASLRTMVNTYRDKPDWRSDPNFWSGAIGVALSLVGLGHWSGTSKLVDYALKSGQVATLIPPIAQFSQDLANAEGLEEAEQNRRLGESLKAFAHAVLGVLQSSRSRRGGGPEGASPPATPHGKDAATRASPVGEPVPAALPPVNAPVDGPVQPALPPVSAPVGEPVAAALPPVSAPVGQSVQAALPQAPAPVSGTSRPTAPTPPAAARLRRRQVLPFEPRPGRRTPSDPTQGQGELHQLASPEPSATRASEEPQASSDAQRASVSVEEEVPMQMAVGQTSGPSPRGGVSSGPSLVYDADAIVASTGSGDGDRPRSMPPLRPSGRAPGDSGGPAPVPRAAAGGTPVPPDTNGPTLVPDDSMGSDWDADEVTQLKIAPVRDEPDRGPGPGIRKRSVDDTWDPDPDAPVSTPDPDGPASTPDSDAPASTPDPDAPASTTFVPEESAPPPTPRHTVESAAGSSIGPDDVTEIRIAPVRDEPDRGPGPGIRKRSVDDTWDPDPDAPASTPDPDAPASTPDPDAPASTTFVPEESAPPRAPRHTVESAAGSSIGPDDVTEIRIAPVRDEPDRGPGPGIRKRSVDDTWDPDPDAPASTTFMPGDPGGPTPEPRPGAGPTLIPPDTNGPTLVPDDSMGLDRGADEATEIKHPRASDPNSRPPYEDLAWPANAPRRGPLVDPATPEHLARDRGPGGLRYSDDPDWVDPSSDPGPRRPPPRFSPGSATRDRRQGRVTYSEPAPVTPANGPVVRDMSPEEIARRRKRIEEAQRPVRNAPDPNAPVTEIGDGTEVIPAEEMSLIVEDARMRVDWPEVVDHADLLKVPPPPVVNRRGRKKKKT